MSSWSAASSAASGSHAAGASSGYGYGHHQPASIEEVRTLWIGDLQYWADENFLSNCFAHTGEVVTIKIIRNKITGQPEGYGFIEFVSHASAERILQTYNGAQMPGTEQTFRLNWASFGMGERRADLPDHSIFVGDLAPDVTDYLLQETFRLSYPSVRGAKVVTDPSTGCSKGYGFVKFADEMERNRAMTEMNGVLCSNRAMRVSAATPKKATGTGVQQQYPATKAVYPAPTYAPAPQLPAVAAPETDMTNTTDPAAAWGAQADATQWTNAYYGYGYDPYAYGAVQDPAYAYGAYAAHGQYPQQVEGVQGMTPMTGAMSTEGHKEATIDPLELPDVNKLNANYLAIHGRAMTGRPLWLKTSGQA